MRVKYWVKRKGLFRFKKKSVLYIKNSEIQKHLKKKLDEYVDGLVVDEMNGISLNKKSGWSYIDSALILYWLFEEEAENKGK
tara:strand:- start:3063 stop:3308 length:246 start_codon:yes stop_codon:yes gene_type:complete